MADQRRDDLVARIERQGGRGVNDRLDAFGERAWVIGTVEKREEGDDGIEDELAALKAKLDD